MKRSLLLFLVFAAGCSSSESTPELPGIETQAVDAGAIPADATDFVSGEEALAYVNPLIGTGGLGFAYAGMTPAVQIPLGFMRVGPDTTRGGSHSEAFHHFSGYYYDDPHLRGFSHTHLVGTGTADYGNLRISFAPEVKLDRPPRRWWLKKLAESEHAEPGYYRVGTEEGVVAEMTAAHHAAIHRYTIPRGIVLAIDPSASVDDEGIEEVDFTYADGELTGRLLYRGDYVGRGRPFELYFAAKIDPQPSETLVWDGDAFVPGTSGSGEETSLAMRWASDARVQIRVGTSLISAENAARRLDGAASFEDVRAETRQLWADELGRIEVAGGTDHERELFYTALYNCFRMPSRLDEWGQYPGMDGEVHDVDHPFHTDLSLWDTYRTLHPLWTLIAPDYAGDAMRSLLLMGRDGGYLPRWPAALSYTSGMEGDSAAILFAEGATKGIDGVDYEAAFDLLMKTAYASPPEDAAYSGRGGIEDYVSLGWIAADRHSNPASNTLEYAVDDGAIAELAKFLGRPEEAEFRERSRHYRNIWDSETRFFRPRNADGSFKEPFSPKRFHERGGDFAEGTAWHYRFYAAHDPEGLIELFGGPDALMTELDIFMEESVLFEGDPAKLFLPDPYYWHTNQPSLHAAFLYGSAGDWDKLQFWVAQIRASAYFSTPEGLVGNDDGGTLSSWYVMASLGIYPIVGTDRWLTFLPAFDDFRINGASPAWGSEQRERRHSELF